jgi:uncharacterized membrane protein
MDNNQFNEFKPQGVSGSNKQLLSYIGLGCSGVGALLVFIFSIVTCARGQAASRARASYTSPLKLSYAWVGVLIGVIICIAGAILLILSKEKNEQLSKIAMIGLIVAVAAIVYACLTTVVICAYNCSFNSYWEKQYGSWFN